MATVHQRVMKILETAAKSELSMGQIKISMSRDNAKLDVIVDSGDEAAWKKVLEKIGLKVIEGQGKLKAHVYPEGSKDVPAKDTIKEWREKIRALVEKETASVETAAKGHTPGARVPYKLAAKFKTTKGISVTIKDKIPTKDSGKFSLPLSTLQPAIVKFLNVTLPKSGSDLAEEKSLVFEVEAVSYDNGFFVDGYLRADKIFDKLSFMSIDGIKWSFDF